MGWAEGRRVAATALASAVVLCGTGARAAEHDREFFTGDALLQRCAAPSDDADAGLRRSACRGYVLGVSDSLQAAQGAGATPTICLGEAESERLVEKVVQYLMAHPEYRRFAGPDLVGAALREAYPCR